MVSGDAIPLNDTCDPTKVWWNSYPAAITRMDFTKTSPLTIKAHFRLTNSTLEFAFEGIVCGYGFDDSAIEAACRSLGCSEGVGNGGYYIGTATNYNCTVTCPDGSTAQQQCGIMLQALNCPSDAMSLIECLTEPLYSGCTGGIYAAQIACTECGD